MAKNEKQIKENKTGYFKAMKSELKKVTWPTPKELFNNTVAVLVFVIIIALIVILSTVVIILFNTNKNDIPNGYIAVFKGESTDVVHTTYLYKEKKKKKYSYINTITRLDRNDSSMWNEEILQQKKLKKKKDIFKVAKENEADSYVKYEKDGNIYTIEEFKKEF